MPLFIAALGFILIPVLTYLAMNDRYRSAWLPREHRTVTREDVGVGAFRRGEIERASVRQTRGGMPAPLRVAAVSCVVLGQMLIPGLLAAGLGLYVMAESGHGSSIFDGNLAQSLGTLPVLVFAAVPGTIVAVYVWRAGLAMFRGSFPDAARRTRHALVATWALNVPLFAFAVFAIASTWRDHDYALITLFYAPLSMIHAAVAYAVVGHHRAAFESEQPADSRPIVAAEVISVVAAPATAR